MASTITLDKTFANDVSSYGTIALRVVVLKPKPRKDAATASEPPPDPSGDLIDDQPGSSPLASYLEKPNYGSWCVVFLVNGQRHHALDNSFIVRSLGFKYLRTRTMIIVDLDGLAPEAISELVQGSRQGLFQGDVYGAILDRIVATLKKDPDLKRLQVEAEQQISELNAGDEVVRGKLDELIDAHHTGATHSTVGDFQAGPNAAPTAYSLGKNKRQDVVVDAHAGVGEAASLPILVAQPPSPAMRLRALVERTVQVTAFPEGEWADIETFEVRAEPTTEGLRIATEKTLFGVDVTLRYVEPDDFDEEAYPVETTLRVYAKFKKHPELRKVERDLIITRRPRSPEEERAKKPKPAPPLTASPTYIRIVSRQPVELLPGGSATHVKVRWDGLDALAIGPAAPWKFRATCTSLTSFPTISFSAPQDGRFEALLDTPHGLRPSTLDFEIEAIGPGGARLVANFKGEVAAPPLKTEPRRISTKAPDATAQRRPPYELKYVDEANWSNPTCWGESAWTKDDPAAMSEPTESAPLTLMINEDAAGLKEFKEGLIKRKLDEATVKERVTRYTTHVAFHLYQMYLFAKAQRERKPDDDGGEAHGPTEEDQRLEIQRVATTLLKVMEVSSR
jgi:hypothetical protein